jgi:hypothetical protein
MEGVILSTVNTPSEVVCFMQTAPVGLSSYFANFFACSYEALESSYLLGIVNPSSYQNDFRPCCGQQM